MTVPPNFEKEVSNLFACPNIACDGGFDGAEECRTCDGRWEPSPSSLTDALRSAYAAGEAAGRAAERERAAKATDEHFISTDTAGQYKYCCDLSSVIRGAFPSPPIAEPAAPPAVTATEQPGECETCGCTLPGHTPTCEDRPAEVETRKVTIAEFGGKTHVSVEPAQPEPALPLSLESRAYAAADALPMRQAPNETDMIAEAMVQLARDFAREALLCLVLDQVSNTPHKYREEIEYAIAAAERPK